jgi:hypothetical protein
LNVQVNNEPLPSDEIMAAYRDLDGLPASVLENVIVARTEEDAATLARTYLGEDRVGPANTHQNDPEGMFQNAMAGPDFVPPIPHNNTHQTGPPPFHASAGM